MAEGVFRRVVAEEGLTDSFVIDSAGLGDWHIGQSPDHRAQKAARTRGIDISGQSARQVVDEDFDRFDLSSFRLKTCTSAPFSAALKADVVRRWPGALIEYYGMTEGGASCGLHANEFPDKLHTVGRPMPGHEMKLIDEEGREVGPGEMGEVVGRSPTMMNGYHGRAEATREAEWYDAEGRRFIRHGDVGRFDEDGFLVLLDRKKDLVISGGFNIYPSDLEAVLRAVRRTTSVFSATRVVPAN